LILYIITKTDKRKMNMTRERLLNELEDINMKQDLKELRTVTITLSQTAETKEQMLEVKNKLDDIVQKNRQEGQEIRQRLEMLNKETDEFLAKLEQEQEGMFTRIYKYIFNK